MQVTVFGASGHVGSLVVEELLNQGHDVNAFVHSDATLLKGSGLKIIKGDIYNAKDVMNALAGSHAVISALGSWGTPRKDILASGMNNIIPAMEQAEITRIISLTGADARDKGDIISPIHRLSHFGIGLIARKVLKDGESHVRMLRGSNLKWTVIRSPVMNGKGSSFYNLTSKRPMPWRTINRHAVAKAMVDQLDDNTFVSQSPFISRT